MIKKFYLIIKNKHIQENDKYKVLKVGDNYVNQYLNYRNLNINRSVSTNFKKINFLDHYLWLNNKRNSFALYKKRK